jgi:hypothetical protein
MGRRRSWRYRRLKRSKAPVRERKKIQSPGDRMSEVERARFTVYAAELSDMYGDSDIERARRFQIGRDRADACTARRES